MPQALADVRQQFGDDAVILATRRIGTGRDAFEVVAAKSAPGGEAVARDDSPQRAEDARPSAVLKQNAPAVVQAETPVSGEAVSSVEGPRLSRTTLFDELRGLQGRLQTLTDLLMANTPRDLSAEGQRMHIRLVESGLDARMATVIIRRALEREMPLEAAVEAEISANVPIGQPIHEMSGQQVIAFVGTTGVGKTTTIAKLAARLVLHEKRSVALISADRFRVGGAHQLGFYAEVLSIPFHTVHNPVSLANAIKTERSSDVVLVDTTGCSSSDMEGVDEVSRLLAGQSSMQTWLALNAVAKRMDNLAALRVFSRLEPTGLIMTKLDETSAHGGAVTVAIRSGLPIHYLTAGQDVPEDISEATSKAVADLVLTGRG